MSREHQLRLCVRACRETGLIGVTVWFLRAGFSRKHRLTVSVPSAIEAAGHPSPTKGNYLEG
jgi:hypothetical protein